VASQKVWGEKVKTANPSQKVEKRTPAVVSKKVSPGKGEGMRLPAKRGFPQQGLSRRKKLRVNP